MTTRETIERYFANLELGKDWDASLAEDMVFTSFTSPAKEVRGKEAYLRSTGGFYSMIRGFQLRELMVDGDRAVALTRYDLQPPNGRAGFSTDVAEVYTVRGDRIASFGIYFDSAPFPR